MNTWTGLDVSKDTLCIGASALWNARDRIEIPIRSVAIAMAVLLLLQAAQTLMMAATLAPLVRPL